MENTIVKLFLEQKLTKKGLYNAVLKKWLSEEKYYELTQEKFKN